MTMTLRVASLLILLVAPLATMAQSLTPNEEWVLNEIANGKNVDLVKRLEQGSTDTDISGAFLKRLITKNLPGAKVPVYGVRIYNATVRGDLDLTNETVTYFVALNNCIFDDNVTLVNAHFQSSLHLIDTSFNNPADFRFAEIDGNLEANKAQFMSMANFEEVKVGGPFFLDDAQFFGVARFYGLKIERNLQASGVQFNNPTEVDFELMHVGGYALFNRRAKFAGPARFYRMTVNGNLEMDDVQFDDQSNGVQFEGIKVGGYFFLRDAIFEGPATFYKAMIGDNLAANHAQFKGTSGFINFESMTVKGHAFFDDAIFASAVSFFDTNVDGKFHASRARFNSIGVVAFNNLKASSIGFDGTSFNGQVTVDGMNYQGVSSGTSNDVLNVISRAKYNSGAYESLAQYYRQQGNASEADAVYIKQRQRERGNLSKLDPRWWWNLVVDWLIGYGRKTERVVYWSLAVVLFGVFVFRKRFMEPRNSDADVRPYSAFLYSLDLFLPVVDFHVANSWLPKFRYRWARRYLPLHLLLGWLLVTIFLSGVTGLIK